MKVLNFNTGRPYGPNGQPITAVYFEDKRVIAFVDPSRHMSGLFLDVDESFLNERSIMNMYDNLNYVQERGPEEYKLTDIVKTLGS